MMYRRDGLLVVDKPVGLTSTQALAKAKRQLGAKKGGHTGTLDPLATGVLVLCFGEATKTASFLLDTDKRYRVTIGLGVSTTTFDAEGEITHTRPVRVADARIDEALQGFVGDIEQIPPRFSAIKKDGVPFYVRARRGDAESPPARQVRIDDIRLISREQDELTIEVECGKGAYIRSLAHDLGERLGCGGHVKALRRLAVGGFTVDQSVPLADIGPQTPLLPSDAALSALPAVHLPPLLASVVTRGQPVHVAEAPTAGWVRLYMANGGFLGIGWAADDGFIKPKRLWV